MKLRRIAGGAALLLAISGLVAVGGTAPARAADLDQVDFVLQPFATVSNPIAMTTRASDPRLYVAERGGTVRIVNTNGTVAPTPVVSISVNQSGERGLLGLTFSLDGTKLYVFYTPTGGALTVAEYTMSGDVGTAPRVLLSIPHPLTNHNGGEMHTGPDGMLYIATGDGGGGGDPDGNAQNKTVLLGKILRINPAPSESLPYTIPSDNPFVGDGGGVREEIWMYGLRNPWRWSFDKTTGDMWIADVGQGEYEEIDYAPAGVGGANWGWDLREGAHPYEGGAQPPDGQDPLFEHSQTTDGFCAIIGGYVYRGTAIPNLQGAYVYGDLCRNRLYAVEQSSGDVIDEIQFNVGISSPVTFGQDINGELYVANLGGTISKLVPDAAPDVSVGDEVMLEGDGRTRAMTFPVTLSRPANTTVTVQYTTAPGTATGGTKPGGAVDYKNRSGTVTFKANNGKTPISKVVSVPVYGDLNAEGDETFTVTLSSPSAGLDLGRTTGTGTILNDEADGVSGISVGIGQGAIVETTSGNQKITVPVTMSNQASGTVSVNYAITPGTASYSQTKTGGGDYGGKISGSIVFTGGRAVVKPIGVAIWPGPGTEGNETFTVTLSGLTGPATLTRTTATITILQN